MQLQIQRGELEGEKGVVERKVYTGQGVAIKEQWKKEWESPEFHAETCVTSEEEGKF